MSVVQSVPLQPGAHTQPYELMPSVQLAPALSGGAFFATCAAVGVGFALLARSLLFVETRGAVALAAAFIIIGTLAAGL